MAKAKRGMGRGLDAILSVSTSDVKGGDELRELPVELIVANPNQPRRHFDEEALRALAGSLGERGVLQPVLVRPKPGGTYELVAGERRWRAAQIAGMSEIPALVRPRDDAATLELALIENMAREDLNPIEEARACAALVEELGLTREEVGRRVGRGRVAVSNLLRLLDLPDEVVETIEQGRLSEGHGRALLLAEDHSTRRVLARDAVREGWSVRAVEGRARTANEAARSGGKGDGGKTKDDGMHPDQREAAATIAASLEAALGAEVRVRPSGGGYRAELSFADVDEAEELARRVRAG
ncbi:MAG TPA: ParB/RepB/Spo0J family partition protein [Solirubrobacteraceae bacterium]|nr:ParB/RepB/Spo0J family partition protein [Solirubrobacteraceae bacterium]